MTRRPLLLLGLLGAAVPWAAAQSGNLTVPKQVTAGAAFSIQTSGSGKATLYIVGTEEVLKRDVDLGQPVSIDAEMLNLAGHYVAVLTGGATDAEQFDVVPADRPAKLAFLARPSRLSTGLHDGISGAVYVFDPYGNLITKPTPVYFQLSGTGAPVQSRTVEAHDGAAWTQMDSSTKEGAAQFTARAGDVSTMRVIQQVPGDPCGLRLSAKRNGKEIQLQTDPLKDCSGNPVPDGTVVTFTESYNGMQTTVDVPLKRGIAQAEVPAHPGATISAATGVVMGNEIHWGQNE